MDLRRERGKEREIERERDRDGDKETQRKGKTKRQTKRKTKRKTKRRTKRKKVGKIRTDVQVNVLAHVPCGLFVFESQPAEANTVRLYKVSACHDHSPQVMLAKFPSPNFHHRFCRYLHHFASRWIGNQM